MLEILIKNRKGLLLDCRTVEEHGLIIYTEHLEEELFRIIVSDKEGKELIRCDDPIPGLTLTELFQRELGKK